MHVSKNLTGQWHHVLSRKIMLELNRHPTLNGVFNRKDFLVQAVNKESHNGYQNWHRIYESSVSTWLRLNKSTTPVQFLNYLYSVYSSRDILIRFPDALRLIQMGIQEIQ